MRRSTCLLPVALLTFVPIVTTTGRAQRAAKPADDRPPARAEPSPSQEKRPALSMTAAVACLSVDAQGHYEPLDDVVLTSAEKLLLFYSPLNYQVSRDGTNHHVHLVQDGRIRTMGKKKVWFEKTGMIDLEWKWKDGQDPGTLFIRSLAALKGLPPGEYEFEITLHDLLAPGEPASTQKVPFRIVPPGPRPGSEPGEANSPRGRSK